MFDDFRITSRIWAKENLLCFMARILLFRGVYIYIYALLTVAVSLDLQSQSNLPGEVPPETNKGKSGQSFLQQNLELKKKIDRNLREIHRIRARNRFFIHSIQAFTVRRGRLKHQKKTALFLLGHPAVFCRLVLLLNVHIIVGNEGHFDA